MSDPVTNVEIEDVLSSIRKLVADDARMTPEKPKPKPKVEKLVLTPAQRVTDNEQGTAPEPAAVEGKAQLPKLVAERPINDIPGDAKLSDFGEVSGAFPDIDTFEAERETAKASTEAADADGTNADRLDLSKLIEQEVAAAFGAHDADEPQSDSLEDEPQYDPFEDELAQIEEDVLHWDAMQDSQAAQMDAAKEPAVHTEPLKRASQPASTDPENAVPEAPQTLEDNGLARRRFV